MGFLSGRGEKREAWRNIWRSHKIRWSASFMLFRNLERLMLRLKNRETSGRGKGDQANWTATEFLFYFWIFFFSIMYEGLLCRRRKREGECFFLVLGDGMLTFFWVKSSSLRQTSQILEINYGTKGDGEKKKEREIRMEEDELRTAASLPAWMHLIYSWKGRQRIFLLPRLNVKKFPSSSSPPSSFIPWKCKALKSAGEKLRRIGSLEKVSDAKLLQILNIHFISS